VGDHLDGVVARRFGGSDYGRFLDASFDGFTDLLFPALALSLHTGFSMLYAAPILAAVGAGVLRLARFSAEGFADDDAHRYAGMPVFYLGFVPPALYVGAPEPVVGVAMLAASGLALPAFAMGLSLIAASSYAGRPVRPVANLVQVAAVLAYLAGHGAVILAA
jgi:phosphatidylserine synthase